jgi:hypothetical protein
MSEEDVITSLHVGVEEVVKEEELATDEAVLLRLKEVLKTVDLDVTTEKMLRITLEAESGRSLAHLKADIRKEVNASVFGYHLDII